MNIPSNDSSAGDSDHDNNPDPHLIEDGASPAPLLIPSVVFPVTAPLDSTPFRNDMIMDATLDAKFLEHCTKMSISMKESILATRHALERLIQGLPESAIKPRASITIQLDQLAAQLARVDQTLEHVTTSQNTTSECTVPVTPVYRTPPTIPRVLARILATQHALEKLIQGLPESAIKPRASITIQLDQLAAQLARVDQTLEHVTTSQNTTGVQASAPSQSHQSPEPLLPPSLSRPSPLPTVRQQRTRRNDRRRHSRWGVHCPSPNSLPYTSPDSPRLPSSPVCSGPHSG
jgi:prefoldin subunit 5